MTNRNGEMDNMWAFLVSKIEDEIRQNILNWQVDFDLEKQALLREVGYNMTILTKHMQKYSNISSLAKIDSDKAVSLVRNMKQTLGASVDGLSRKVS